MSTEANISHKSNNVNELLESDYAMVIDAHIHQIRAEALKKLEEYQKTVTYMAADAPISVLCLPKNIEKTLLRQGCLRVYDMIDRDLTKIEGLSDSAARHLAASLNQFLSMCF